jgi:hypothetical protein
MSLTTNLISYWKLDGDATDATATHNDGTPTDITFNTGNGKINQGAGFNGTTSQIKGSSVNIATNATIECWFKTTQSIAGHYPIFFGFKVASGYVSFNINLQADTGKIELFLRSSVGTENAAVDPVTVYNDGNWHHAVGVKTGLGIELFVDNVSKGTATIVGSTGNFNGAIPIFGSQIDSDFYSGALDECGYWSRALTSGDVTSLWNGGAGLAYPLTVNSGNMLLIF